LSAEGLNWNPESIDSVGLRYPRLSVLSGLLADRSKDLAMIKETLLAILMCMTVPWAFGYESLLSAQEKPLRIYGPEGPFAPIRECAELFSRTHGIKAEVLTAPESNWIKEAKEDADVVYEETEQRLSRFMMRHR
jgi:accessory colonization factor AcfC